MVNRLRFFYLLLLLFLIVNSNNVWATVPLCDFPSNVQFVENKKQWEHFIKYQAEFRGGKLFLEENKFTYVFYHPDDFQSLHPHEGTQLESVRLHAVKINPVDANLHPVLTSYDTASHFNNYFIGKDPAKWASDVRIFSTVVYNNLYPNIDMKFYSSMSDIKYDFILKPGSNSDDIQLAFDGVDKLSLQNGNLIINLSVGEIIEEKPYAYQIINNKKKEISCKFVLKNNRLSFRFPNGYNKSIPVIIDPTLIFSSFTGSTADNWGFTATYDAAGNLYSGGNVNAIGYPVTPGAYQQSYSGGGISGNGWSCDIAIAKFNPTGSALLYATYLGGSDNDQPHSLVVDNNNNLIIFGTSYSSNYPTTLGCYDNTINGAGDIIISKLSVNGNQLLGSTFVGGSADDGLNTDPKFGTKGPIKYNYGDQARGEIISDINNEYIIGSCSKSNNFPTTSGTVQSVFNGVQDGIVFKINSSLTGIIWSTYVGGSQYDAVYDCVIDMNGELFIAGGTNSTNFYTKPGGLNESYLGGLADGFLVHLNSTATSILASTFIGTTAYDQTFFVELDFDGDVYCTGQTEGIYPITPGVYSTNKGKQFIHKLNADLSNTIYSMVFGNGSAYPNISPTAFLVDTCENVYVAGWGRCLSLGSFTAGNVMGMPITSSAFQTTTDGCDFYFFVLARDGLSLSYSTYFGGAASADHVDGGTSRFDKNGVIYGAVCTGCGGRSDFPTTPGVVSNTNNSLNCNNGVIKLAFNLYKTVSGISTSTTSGCAPFTLTFNNSSINSISYLWDFGDGTPQSNVQTPTHTFTSPGVYRVMLLASNSNSCNQNDTSFVLITVVAPLQLPTSFTVNQTNPCDSFLVNLQSPQNSGILYQWDFGDGFVTNSFNPSHLYSDSGTYRITLTVIDIACPTNVNTISNTVRFLLPAVVAGISPLGSTNGCTPVNVSFTNNSTTSGYHFWDFMDGSPIDTSFQTNHTFTIPGNYNVMFVVTDSLSCNTSDTAFVNVNVLPVIPVIPDFNTVIHQACMNPSADFSFSGSGGNSYQWDFGDGTFSSGPNSSHTYSSPGEYLVTLTINDSICGASGTISQLISFFPPVSASVATIGAIDGCAPLNVSFTNNSSTGGNHFWNFMDGSAIDTSFNTNHTFSIPGNYSVMFVVADSLSCNNADTAFVNVNVLSSAPVIPAFIFTLHSLCTNPFADFSFSGSGGNLFNWSFGDGSFSTGFSTSHTYSNPGDYLVTLTVSDSVCGAGETISQLISFYPPASASIAVPGSKEGCAPLNVSFSNNSSTGGIHFWYFMDGSPVDTAFNANHTFTSLGTYHVMFVVTDSLSCNLADTAFIIINVLPFVPVVPDFNTIIHPLCANATADFSFSGTGGILFRWDFGDGTFASGPITSHTFSNPGDYLVTLTIDDSVCGSTGTISKLVSFYAPVSASVAVLGSNNGCAPLNISFSNSSSTGGNHFWNFMDGSPIDTSFNVNHTFTVPGIYDVMFVVSDSLSCNKADSAIVIINVLPFVPIIPAFNTIVNPQCTNPSADFSFSGSGGNSFNWNFGDGTFSSGINVSHAYATPGDYLVTLTVDDSICNSTGTISQLITFYPPASASVNVLGSGNGCAPLNVSFSNSSSTAGNHFWDFMDGSPIDTSYNTNHTFTVAGIYNVRFIVSDPNSCNISDTDFVLINIFNSIPVNASFNLFTASNCDSSEVLVTFNGTGGTNYFWDFGDGTTGSGISTNHHYPQAGNYLITLLVKDSICGFSDSVSQEVIVRPSVRAFINTNQVLFGCAPQTIRFSNAFNSTGIYLWDLGDNTYSNLKIVDHNYQYPGLYFITLTVSDSASCNMEAKAVYNLKVYEKPKAGFTFIQNNHSLYTEVDFYNNSSANAAFYLWDFADSTFESSAGPVNHKYYQRGNYNVCLNVTTIEGCADTTCDDIIVENDETIYIPSSFSPNGDGKNDFFKIYFTGLSELEIIIYDRWGVKLFESKTLDGSWDGTYKGEPVLQDVYVYKLTAKGLMNDHIEKTGRVTLIY